MRISGYSVPIIVLAFLLGLGSMLGIQYLYKNQQVDKPLAELLEADERIAFASMDVEHGVLVVKVKLHWVDDLKRTYIDLENAIRNIVPDGKFRIELDDDRNDNLEHVYYLMHFSLQQGIATGEFTEMADNVNNVATTHNVDHARVFVDHDRLFVQLKKSNHYLYEVLPRTSPNPDKIGGNGA